MRLPSPRENRPHMLIQLAHHFTLALMPSTDSETRGNDSPEVGKGDQPGGWIWHMKAQGRVCGSALDKGQKA